MCCPHWRSVFSSVFKEPKLGRHAPSVAAGATRWSWCRTRRPIRPSEASSNTIQQRSEASTLSSRNFPTTIVALALAEQQVPPAEQVDVAAAAPSASSTRFPARTAPWLQQAAHLAVRLGHTGLRRAARAPGRRRVAPAASTRGTSRGDRREHVGRGAGRIAAEQHVGGLVGGARPRRRRAPAWSARRRARAARAAAPAPRRARRAAPRSRRADAATASSGTCRPSASSLWIQNWRNWYGEVRAGSSHTAPPTDLPNLAPSALGHQRMRHRERLLRRAGGGSGRRRRRCCPTGRRRRPAARRRGARTGGGSRWPAAACS